MKPETDSICFMWGNNACSRIWGSVSRMSQATGFSSPIAAANLVAETAMAVLDDRHHISTPVNVNAPGIDQKISRGLEFTVVRIVTGLLERQFGNT